MSERSNLWRVLLVEDDPEAARQVKEWFDSVTVAEHHVFQIDPMENFDQAMGKLEETRYDVVVLDIYRGPAREGGDDAGRRLLDEIQARRFVPIIFYSALPPTVEDLISPVIEVVEKGVEGLPRLQATLLGFADSGLLRLVRGFSIHVDQVLREYLWDFVPRYWDQFGTSADKVSLAYMLSRRLAASLEQAHLGQLLTSLGLEMPDVEPPRRLHGVETCHPAQMYIMPPLERPFHMGDILRKEEREGSTHWIVLTPTCDILLNKAENLVLAKCHSLCEFRELTDWKESLTDATKKKLRLLLRNRAERRQEDRYWYLPGVFELPHLVVDFQYPKAVPRTELEEYEIIASLDSPFAEALAQRFIRYIGRIGVPDLDVDAALRSLQ